MRRGFILVMAAGLLTILGVVSVLFLNFSGFAGLAAHAAVAGSQARLAAESGLAYAAGRLWESPDRFPGAPRLGEPGFDAALREATVANRGDDWHYREYDRDDGSHFSDRDGPIPPDWLDPPLESTAHPSYAHGEAWNDLDKDGLRDPGEPWIDADGNGRPDVQTGRLRGTPGARFLLRVETGVETKLPLNVLPDPENALFPRLREGLNRLGAVLGVSTVTIPTREGVPLVWSDLAERIFAEFPPEGWRRVEDLRKVLPRSHYRSIRRFVTTASPLHIDRHLILETDTQMEAPRTVPLSVWNLNGAPARFVEASLRFRIFFEVADRVARGLSEASPAPIDPVTQLPYTAYPDIVLLHPEEAHRAARDLHLRARRTGGFRSRLELFRFIDGRKQDWFPNGILHATAPEKNFPSEGYQNAKTDLVFASFFGGRSREAPFGLATYDVDRFVRNASRVYPGDGRQTEPVPLANLSALIGTPVPPIQDGQPWDGNSSKVEEIFQWALGPVRTFDVLSLASGDDGRTSAAAEGFLRIGDAVWLKSQEDFQNLGGYPLPWGREDQVRNTTRGIRVERAPDFHVGSGPLGVVTFPKYPRETFDPGFFVESKGAGGVTLAHAPQDYLSGTGGVSQLRFEYLVFPDPSDILAQQTWTPDFDGRMAVPVSRVNGDPRTELSREANIDGMRKTFDKSTPFGTSLDTDYGRTSSPRKRYSFHQADAGNPNGLPALPVGSAPVPALLMDAPGGGSVGTGDFRAITHLVVHLTHTGPLTASYDPTRPEESVVFTLQTSANELPHQWGGGSRMRLLKRGDGKWILEFLNGSIVAINPSDPGEKVAWQDARWGSWLNGPGPPGSRERIEAGHTQRFEGLYQPFAARGLSTPPNGLEDEFWEDPAVHRITIYYFAEDNDASYPPRAIRCGVLIDGQIVVTHFWEFDPMRPCLPFAPPAACTPLRGPYPSAELFYRVGPSGRISGLDLASDGRRILDVAFDRCTDVVFAAVPGDLHNPNADVAEIQAKDLHHAYRGAARDFFRRQGTFTSARYVLPEPAAVEEINWGAVLPQAVWEGLGSPERALSLTLRARRPDGADLPPVRLRLAKIPSGEAGAEPFYLPVGSPRAPWKREKIASFTFEAVFDVAGWHPPPPSPTPPFPPATLEDAPALEELWIHARTAIRWADPTSPVSR